MHRINKKRKRVIVLRTLAYGAILLLSSITTAVLFYVAQGYRFDGINGHVVRTGLLLVKNEPEAAEIYINGKLEDASAPGRFVLSAGKYDVSLRKSGYREWKKNVSVLASGVREVSYPLLIPEKLSSQTQFQVAAPSLVTQSNDRKFLLLYSGNQTSFELIELKNLTPKHENIPLPAAIKRENSQVGTLRAIEWALDNKHVLLEQTLPSGAVELISLDVTKPEEARNVTALYAGKSLQDPHYAGEDTDALYGIREGVLHRFNFEKDEEKTLLEGVRSYQPYGNETILYDRIIGPVFEVGIWLDDKATRVHVTQSEVPTQLAYAQFNDNYYLSIAEPSLNMITLYRDPLKNPLKEKQSPFHSFSFEGPQHISLSSSGQFLLIQNGSTLATYDFDEFKRSQIHLPFEIAAGTKPAWLNATHLYAQAADGANYLFEYDGQNMQQILSSRLGSPISLSPDFKYVYRIVENDTAAHFESASMLVD